MKKTLFLASQSPSRQMLLREAEIPFVLALQDADETACDWTLPLAKLVQSIAQRKMAHAIIPNGSSAGEMGFVLTADTLSQDMDGKINGKPVDRVDAVNKIRAARNGTRLCSAFCLERRVWCEGKWQVEERVEHAAQTSYRFMIPDEWIEIYLECSPGLRASNAIAVEGYGGQFLREVNGSYSAIVGLPMFELREALESLGFFSV